MEERKLNPSQAEAYIGLVREIRSHLASGQTAFEPEAYKSIRTRARQLEPVKNEIVTALCDAIKDGTFSIAEVKAFITYMFGRRDQEPFKQLDLTMTELGTMLDLEFERVLQNDRRSIDQELVYMFNESRHPEALTAQLDRLCQEETYWLKTLSSLDPFVNLVIQNRGQADALEAKIEQLNNQIATLNGRIRILKLRARKANNEEVLLVAEEAEQLCRSRNRLRAKVENRRRKLREMDHAWLLSTEQWLESQASQSISALELIVSEAHEAMDFLANPPVQERAPKPDELNVLAEAYMNVVLRLRERIPGQSKYKREFMEALAQRLENEAYMLEV